jgi:hypothetical protein
LAYRAHQVDGDRGAFNTLNYFGQGGDTFTDQGQMSLSGRKVFGFLDFSMQFADNRLQDPDQRRTTLTFDGHPFKFTYGDVNGSLLNTNRFARFNRLLNGAMLDYSMGRTAFRAVRSQTRGAARTVSITGNNSSGPYYLQSGRIRPDTLDIRVDNVSMRLGIDYDLDSDLGAVTFINRVIAPTSVILATYESAAFNEQRGTVQGAGFTYDFGKFGTLGASYIEQVSGNRVDANSKVELFQGQGVPSVGYDLDYEPIPGSVFIRVGTVPQVEGVDFTFDSSYARRFYMTRYVDPSVTVSVTYRPKVIQTVTGDRRVSGLDWAIPFTRTDKESGRKIDFGYFRASQATGEAIGQSGGTARNADFQYRHVGLTLSAAVRDVPSNFVSIESRGFNRNERATELGLDYVRGEWSFGTKMTNSVVTTNSVVNNVARTNLNRYTTTTANVLYRQVDGVQWNLEHSRIRNRVTSDVALDTTGLTASRRFGKLSTNLGIDFQQANGFSSVNPSDRVSVNLQTFRTGLQYAAGQDFDISARANLSQIRQDAQNSSGTDFSIGANWKPTDRWTLVTTYTNSNSGSISTLGGINTGAGLGYGGNGFSSGGLGDAITLGRNSVRSLQAVANHRSSDRFSLSMRAYQTASFGDLNANADTFAYGVGLEWDLSKQNLLSLSLDRTRTRFGGSNQVQSNAYTIALTGAPGRANYSAIIAGSLNSGQSSQFGQNVVTYDLSAGYRLHDRHRLIAGLSNSNSTGYFGQKETVATLGYEYRIFQNIGLQALYRFRNVQNQDPQLGAGSYRSRGLDIELTFSF